MLDNAPGLQQVSGIGKLQRDPSVLFYQKDGHLLLRTNALHDGKDVFDYQRRKSKRRFIKKKQRRPSHECPSDGKHLLLTARQCSGLLRVSLLEAREIVIHPIKVGGNCSLILTRMTPQTQVFFNRHRLECSTSIRDMTNSHGRDLFGGLSIDAITAESN